MIHEAMLEAWACRQAHYEDRIRFASNVSGARAFQGGPGAFGDSRRPGLRPAAGIEGLAIAVSILRVQTWLCAARLESTLKEADLYSPAFCGSPRG